MGVATCRFVPTIPCRAKRGGVRLPQACGRERSGCVSRIVFGAMCLAGTVAGCKPTSNSSAVGSGCATVEEFRARVMASNYEGLRGNAAFVESNIRDSSEIRSWIAENFDSMGDAGTDVMRGILALAPEHVYPEFSELIRSLLESDYFCAPAIMCLSYYDIPGRREILREFSGGEGPASCDGAEWFAIAAHLDAYGEIGIEAALERALAARGSETDRLSMAGMIAAHAAGVWRDRAWERIDGLLESGVADRLPALTAKVLDDTAAAGSCGTKETADLVRRLSQIDRDGLAEAANRFDAACLHEMSRGE